jgi:hypothetical protein
MAQIAFVASHAGYTRPSRVAIGLNNLILGEQGRKRRGLPPGANPIIEHDRSLSGFKGESIPGYDVIRGRIIMH